MPAAARTGPLIMGVLNVTPDSFSDGGRFGGVDAAVEHGLAMAREGAAVIDVGGESTRPGAQRVTADEQIARAAPVITRLRAALDAAGFDEAAISIDTTQPAVGRAALDAGAAILNDVSAGRESDGVIFRLAADRGAPLILMHMLGQPATMQANPHYDDVVGEVRAFLLARAAAAEAAGVPRSQIVIDPGIGFGKTLEHNLALLAHLGRLVETGYPVLVGASRKAMIGQLAAGAVDASGRLGGTCAVSVLAAQAGAAMVRVHDVRDNVQAVAVASAIDRARRVP